LDRPRVDDRGDAALAHQRGRMRARGDVGEEGLDVALARFLAGDAVARALAALDAARDLDLAQRVPRRWRLLGVVVDQQRDLGDVARRARGGAREDDVVHRPASTRFDLPQPLGPTMPVMPGSIRNSVASTNDLNPATRSLANCIDRSL